MKPKLLFICTSNITRSVTAEAIAKRAGYEAKSAGTALHAAKRVTQELIDWADMIFVMNEQAEKHLSFLKEHFDLQGKEVIDLNVGGYLYAQPNSQALVEDLTKGLQKYLTL